jgi:hypothetical protein
MNSYKDFIIDIKSIPLRDSTEFTTHIAIYRDSKNVLELVKSVHMGNRCVSAANAHTAGEIEAKRIIGTL